MNLPKIPWNKSKCPNVKLLRAKYITEKKGSHAIAPIFGVSQTLIIAWLKREGIAIRSRSEAAKITLNGVKENEANPMWKGDKASYGSIHDWVRKRLGTPSRCENCGSTNGKHYEWANLDNHSCKRNLEDWIRLCAKCHRRFDHGLITVSRNQTSQRGNLSL